MKSMFYKELIGKKIHLIEYNYKNKHEWKGTVLWVEGCYIGLELLNGERIAVPKMQNKHDSITFLDEEVFLNG